MFSVTNAPNRVLFTYIINLTTVTSVSYRKLGYE